MQAYKAHQKAQDGQTLVRQWLEANSFVVAEVKNVSANGVDILAIKNGVGFTVEVKTVIGGERGSRVKKPHPKSDFIAVVMPSGHIYVETTADWMKLTAKDGTRSMTKVVDFYRLLKEAPTN